MLPLAWFFFLTTRIFPESIPELSTREVSNDFSKTQLSPGFLNASPLAKPCFLQVTAEVLGQQSPDLPTPGILT